MRRSRVLSEAFHPLEVYEYHAPGVRRRRFLFRALIIALVIWALLLIRNAYFLPPVQ